MPSAIALNEGSASALGAVPDGAGVNFALFSAHAEKVELCLLENGRERARLPLPARTGDIWHGHLKGAENGLQYGYRVYGPYDPARGHRFNPHKLLVDPCARALTSSFAWSDENCGYIVGDRHGDLSFDKRDNAHLVPKSIVLAESARASGLRPTGDSIYELHVRGMTMRHPDVPERLRGTLAGLTAAPVLDHLRGLGIGAVELMPVTPAAMSRRLAQAGLINYWGYNPINFFAVEPRLMAGPGDDLRSAVARFHDAGIAVILDMVFNHSGEEDEFGPTISFRGIDNASYYRLAEDKRRYVDWTGCKNTLNTAHPMVRRMILESLRHWAGQGVDGFRLDLAVTLGRDEVGEFSPHAALLAEIAADPVLAKLQLIAEPWDLGPDGYRPGSFEPPWAEWNDKFRDRVRRFWRGEGGVGELATRLAGSSDLVPGRPEASVNFVTAHDGFTLADLAAYAVKHNAANLEDGRDGTEQNFSDNGGVEGPSDDPAIVARRAQRVRNFLATLLLSAGRPMLRAGDEFGHSQSGNNNAYCQDNDISWLDWPAADPALIAFTRDLLALRRAHPGLRGEGADPLWFSEHGELMTEADWNDGHRHLLGMLCADGGTAVLLLLNGGSDEVRFILPPSPREPWHVRLSTSAQGTQRVHAAGDGFALPAHSLVLFADREEGPPAA